jgi:predicted nucleic acid-binding protein
MRNGIVVADAGPIFSLSVINKLDLLHILFDEVKIPNEEIITSNFNSL